MKFYGDVDDASIEAITARLAALKTAPFEISLEGLGALVGTIERVKAALNPGLDLEGVVFCMFDRRTNLAQQVVKEVKEHLPGKVFETMIPQNIRLSESPSFGKPALLYDIESRGAQAYLTLAKELLARRAASAEQAAKPKAPAKKARSS